MVLTPLNQGPVAGQETQEEARSCSGSLLASERHGLGFCEAVGEEEQTTRRKRAARPLPGRRAPLGNGRIVAF